MESASLADAHVRGTPSSRTIVAYRSAAAGGARRRETVGREGGRAVDRDRSTCHATPMIGAYLTGDHRRLDALLDAAVGTASVPSAPDLALYGEFRRGLLRHIALEEKILLPAAQEASGGAPLALATRLRLDHGAIASLLVPSPTPAVVATLRHVLASHNPIEEGPDGVYAICDALLADRAETLVEAMRAQPEVRVNAHNDAPGVMPAVVRALERAGYALLDPGRGALGRGDQSG
jgi:hypothetical protein